MRAEFIAAAAGQRAAVLDVPAHRVQIELLDLEIAANHAAAHRAQLEAPQANALRADVAARARQLDDGIVLRRHEVDIAGDRLADDAAAGVAHEQVPADRAEREVAADAGHRDVARDAVGLDAGAGRRGNAIRGRYIDVA